MDAVSKRVPSVFLIPLILFFVGLALGIALLNGRMDLTILCLILFAVVAVAKAWTHWSMGGLECGFTMAQRRAFPGETLLLEAAAENRKFLPVWLEARVAVGGLGHEGSPCSAVQSETGLLWQQKARFRWELTAQKRGVHRIGPLSVTTGDLFGFFPREKGIGRTMEVLVYPRIVPLKPLSLPRRDFFGIPGPDSPVEDPVHILGTRDYQSGRPARHIHWKATARHNRLQQKIFEPSVQEKVLLAVDVGPFARHGANEAFERALETVASLAVQLDQRGCSVGLVTNGLMDGAAPSVLPVSRNPQQLGVLLEMLARVRMEAGSDLIDALRTVRLPWGVSGLFFALEGDDAARDAATFFAQRGIPLLGFVDRSPSVGVDGWKSGGVLFRTLGTLLIGKGCD